MADSMIDKLLKKDFIFLDGGMGTMLQQSGLEPGSCPETLCFTNEDIIEGIHRQYIESGSDIIYSCAFGANRRKLAGTGYEPSDVVKKAVQIAKRAAAGTETKIALDIGPIGELLEPMGALSFEEAYDIFREMLTAGEEAGADIAAFETMTGLQEVRAGVLAAKENTNLPIFVTMTYEETGRTFTGCSIEAMACTLSALGVDAIGINCSLGPAEIFPLAEKLSACTNLPIIIKPNAGLPDPKHNTYNITAAEFAAQMKKYPALGIRIMGGCCGTTPEYIQELVKALKGQRVTLRKNAAKSVICTASKAVTIAGVHVIGENLNPTGKKHIQEALRKKDFNHLMGIAIEQASAGAEILDINVGLPGIDEAQMMVETIKAIQRVTDLPLQIDSSNPKAIEAGLRIYSGKAIVNSVHATDESMEAIFPLVKKYGAAVIGLTIDEKGIPKNAEERVAIARRILARALEYEIPKEDVFIDCLTLTVSAQQEQVKETLNALKTVKEELGLQAVLGVSNISFGIPNRELVSQIFLIKALSYGLTLPIINPMNKANMDAISAFRVLSGEDKDCASYISKFSNASGGSKVQAAIDVMTLGEAVAKGLREDSARITRELLKEKNEFEIINDLLIPALDQVGEQYEKQEIFLPQLINSADASCEAFEVIKKNTLAKGEPEISKGKIILATVKGDVHDIGKNIVKILLENYGYEVIDLGKDVPVDTIVEAAIKEDVGLVGLSALMTTTLVSMKETIRALRDSGHNCKIVVGGAVLTPQYAKEIGADYYAADAKQGVDIAKSVFLKKMQKPEENA